MVTNANAELDIQFDKPSKQFRPNETVTGTISLKNCEKAIEHGKITLLAEGYMDTVSTFQKLTPLPIAQRVTFFSKAVQIVESGKFFPNGAPHKFSFVLEKTEKHELVDTYEGIAFSILYKV